MPVTPQQQIEFASEITAELRRLVGELYELREDAAHAGLQRAQLRIERAIATLDSTANGLATHAGKAKAKLARLNS